MALKVLWPRPTEGLKDKNQHRELCPETDGEHQDHLSAGTMQPFQPTPESGLAVLGHCVTSIPLCHLGATFSFYRFM